MQGVSYKAKADGAYDIISCSGFPSSLNVYGSFHIPTFLEARRAGLSCSTALRLALLLAPLPVLLLPLLGCDFGCHHQHYIVHMWPEFVLQGHIVSARDPNPDPQGELKFRSLRAIIWEVI